MYVKKAIAYQRGRTGVEYRINKSCGKYILFNALNMKVTTEILGPDS
jgi:hypothetical protein